jgi:hypothetical protein
MTRAERLLKEVQKLWGEKYISPLTTQQIRAKGMGRYLVQQGVLTPYQWSKFLHKYKRDKRALFWPEDYIRALQALFPDKSTDIQIAIHGRDYESEIQA